MAEFGGLVCAGDRAAAPSGRRDSERGRDVMSPASDVPPVTPDTPAVDAVRLMRARGADRLAVIGQGRLLGFVDHITVERAVRLISSPVTRRHVDRPTAA